jgi:hypothetical protein
MKQIFSTLWMILAFASLMAQPNTYLFSRFDSIPVTINSSALDFPWAGGLNYSQFSNIDLNFDGNNDLFIFDRTGNKTLTFLHSGVSDVADFQYAPDYEAQFPNMTNWALLVDYNCDGLPDIFTNSPGGIRIFKNTSSILTGISFVMVENLLYSYFYSGMVNLYVSSVDLPAITDIDNDGDVDILTFGLVGSKLEYHKNLSVESGFGCDSLHFRLKNDCWGNFSEAITNNELTLFDTCATTITSPEIDFTPVSLIGDVKYDSIEMGGIRHSGSCLIAFDNNGINSKDLLLGDISAKNLVYAENGGVSPNLNSSIIAQDTLFPSYNIPINIKTMACPFNVDVNNDGNLDLIVTPQSTAVSENAKGVAYYQNDSITTFPNFNFQTSNLFQIDMIERGEGALPVLFDYDNDGLLDLLVSNYGFFNASTDTYTSKLCLFRNNGSATQPSFIQINDNFENLSATMNDFSLHPAFGDLNNDGDGDMLVGGYNGTLFYFENIAGAGNPADFVLSQANLTDNTTSIIDVGQYSTPFLKDLDRDGDNDLLIGERNGNINYYENIGTASVFSFRYRTDTLGGIKVNQAGYVTGFSVPSVYDDNGKYQLIIGSQTGYVHHYDSIENNILGSYRKVDTTLLGYPHGIRSGVAPVDINNDGYMDLFTGNYRGGLSFFKGDSQGTIGIKEEVLSQIHIYPNPTQNSINFEFNSENEVKLKLVDITGRIIREDKIYNGYSLDIHNLADGIYFICLEYQSQTITHKIVKQ